MQNLRKLRNIGISAHVDSGKTTLTERILYFSGRIHDMREVKDKSGRGTATMDFDPQEATRGITINSACTQCQWQQHSINIIDTPGHVDFTIEVERSLKVLDGAILVLCGVSGVQAQSFTVDRQMKRYEVPGLAFINKLDLAGADAFQVCQQLRQRLAHNAVLFQLPIGSEKEFRGVIDLLQMRALYFEGDKGREVRVDTIPKHLCAEATAYRQRLLEAVADIDDDVLHCLLEDCEPHIDVLKSAVRRAVISRSLTPVFLGSAYANIGVQPLLDAVLDYLPSPADCNEKAKSVEGEEVQLRADAEAPLVAYVFKLDEDKFGQLSYLRIYQGRLTKGMTVFDPANSRKYKVGRLVRLHAASMQELDQAEAGDIVALFGIDCAGGTTLADAGVDYCLGSMHVPDAVIDLRIEVQNRDMIAKLSRALNRFRKEDPTFRVSSDPESGETIISGMGELHLEVYLERLRSDYQLKINCGRPSVAFRERLNADADFDYLYKKQTGGQGQYARICGRVEVTGEDEFEFIDEVRGGAIPKEYVSSVEQGFREALCEGLNGYPLQNLRIRLTDGQTHENDSSDLAFRTAARRAMRRVLQQCGTTVLEPVMKVEVQSPKDFQGAVISSLSSRRGLISASQIEDEFCRVEAAVPLAEMFAYSSALRSQTQGQAEFSMEFLHYAEKNK